MKYRDLIQFEPIESVIQLKESNRVEEAKKLVDTYVISDRMAEQLTRIVFEQLWLEGATDNKGLLVVGNYGTGKSHMMSVISAIAEHDALIPRINHPEVREKAAAIGGRFKVIRAEMGATEMGLRDVVCGELQDGLAALGVDFTFPPPSQVRSYKDQFTAMMAKFHEKYPDHGLLLALDELLDYLKSRKEHDLILDLGFLREIGEVCRISRFRFIAGLQEMLFGNPRFQFVAEQLRRVRDRFEQVRIVREDIATVVAERLLKKDERQKALIREHLQRFTKLYNNLNERMEQYVSLFPVHPAYLETFERVYIAEKREVLKTISAEIRKRFDEEVPADQPGLVSYDSYWPYIEANATLSADPNVREVMIKSKILRDRVEHSLPKKQYKEAAIRIVHALSVHRLTTGDIHNPVGVTAEELRDDLFLYLQGLPEEDAVFLRSSVESVLKEIMRTVSYQYISFNRENGQYYLDLKKDIDVDNLIEQKAEALSDDQLDRHYFDVLAEVADCPEATYRPGFRIWQHELPWQDRRVNRPGYLFFGAPNERSTTQPPRDYYLYFLEPFNPPKFRNEELPDEVFFRLNRRDEVFLQNLHRYAGAKELAMTAATGTKRLYEEKADQYLKQLSAWLRDNAATAFDVTYRGVTKLAIEWVKGSLPSHPSLRELIDYVGAACLAPWFEQKLSDYPSFKALPGTGTITTANRPAYASDAIKWITGQASPRGEAILKGLVLLNGNKLEPRASGYARWILDRLEGKGEGQVVNRHELIEIRYSGADFTDVCTTQQYDLEPEWLAVILAALVKSGDIEIVLSNNRQIDATNIQDLPRIASLEDLIDFKYIKKPSGLPLNVLNELFDFLGIPPSLLGERSRLEDGVQLMQKRIREFLEETIQVLQIVKEGIDCWGEPLLSETEKGETVRRLEDLKAFLESLTVFNTPAKLNHVKHTVDKVKRQRQTYDQIGRLKQLKARAEEVQRTASYIQTASQVLPVDHPWSEKATGLRRRAIDAVRSGRNADIIRELQSLKSEYVNHYMDRHRKHRLGVNQEAKKNALEQDTRLRMLEKLSRIDLMPLRQLQDFKAKLSGLKVCWRLVPEDLEARPVCPHCRFSPAAEPVIPPMDLDALEDELGRMLEEWTASLCDVLSSENVWEKLDLLSPDQAQRIRSFIHSRTLPDPMDELFIEAVQTALDDIEKASISLDRLTEVLGNGTPLTPEEAEERFRSFIRSLTRGKDTKKVRIVLDIQKKGE